MVFWKWYDRLPSLSGRDAWLTIICIPLPIFLCRKVGWKLKSRLCLPVRAYILFARCLKLDIQVTQNIRAEISLIALIWCWASFPKTFHRWNCQQNKKHYKNQGCTIFDGGMRKFFVGLRLFEELLFKGKYSCCPADEIESDFEQCGKERWERRFLAGVLPLWKEVTRSQGLRWFAPRPENCNARAEPLHQGSHENN